VSKPIIVFDGECALCNGFVAWLIRHDSRAVFLIAGSAGEVGRAVVGAAGLEGALIRSTIVVWDGERGLVRSDAVLAILARLGWPWRAAVVGRLVPRRWRDAVYGAVAKRRARIDADDAACGVPPAELVTAWRSRLATLADVPQTGADAR
jgi:predicted DCC family thiol-disulfide oxidoreductase YuxK